MNYICNLLNVIPTLVALGIALFLILMLPLNAQFKQMIGVIAIIVAVLYVIGALFHVLPVPLLIPVTFC